MGRACTTHEEKRNAYRVLVESQNERGHQEDLDLSGRIILKTILEWGGMEGIHLVHDRDQWRALVNTITNLQVP
jgi:hypothetical protein